MLFKNSHQREGKIEQSARSLDITASLNANTSSNTKLGSAAKLFPINNLLTYTFIQFDSVNGFLFRVKLEI